MKEYWERIDARCHVLLVRNLAYRRYARRVQNDAGLTLILEAERLVMDIDRSDHLAHRAVEVPWG